MAGVAGRSGVFRHDPRRAQGQRGRGKSRTASRNATLVEVKDALNRSERLAALGLLASSVAHEVGTPLHSIAWQVQALAEDPHVTSEMRKTIEIIEAELNRVVRIIKEKLIADPATCPCPGPDATRCLGSMVVTLMNPSFMGKGVGLKTDVGHEASSIMGDVEQLRQVLVNLLTNALAATSPGGDVVIVVGRRAATLTELEVRRRAGQQLVETMVTLTVRDTGCGMPDDHVLRAFEPFSRPRRWGMRTRVRFSQSWHPSIARWIAHD